MKSQNAFVFNSIFEDDLLNEISKEGKIYYASKNDILIDIGEKIQFIPLIIEGSIKVIREDENGEELLLYFVETGGTCAMTLNCCMEDSISEIRALCESDTRMIMIPLFFMDSWLTNYKSWRTFIFNNYHNRLLELLKAIDSVTFMNLEERLERYLKDRIRLGKTNLLEVTHQQIAIDLNSSRVVISRLLKKMEKKGIVALGRNFIEFTP